ncbi:MAG: phospholipase D-like domain-containing protein [Elusimicrobiota bacterium]|nr:MAG: phospholipase D-like domain-containing protein [Elusimicrobiota bacterium]
MIHFSKLHQTLDTAIKGAGRSVELFSPYISVAMLERLPLVGAAERKVTIVTSWRLTDLMFGASDPKLFDYCRQNGIFLFVNQKLHLKSFLLDGKRLFTGSANLTLRGLGAIDQHNHETLVEVAEAPEDYLLFLSRIKQESTLVTESLSKKLEALFFQGLELPPMDQLKQLEKMQSGVDDLLQQEKQGAFLISQLPMSRSIDDLFAVFMGGHGDDEQIQATARHDIANYDLAALKTLSNVEFRAQLATRFFAQPFVSALCAFIDRPRRFGEIKEWVQRRCTDVPVPSRRDLTGNVQVLYQWLVDLGPDRFEVRRPQHTELICPKSALSNARAS